MDNVMAVAECGIEEAYVFANGNVKADGKIVYLPIYMVMFLRDDPAEFADISVDRFNL